MFNKAIPQDCCPHVSLIVCTGEPGWGIAESQLYASCKGNSHQKPAGQRLFLDLGIQMGNHFLLQMSPLLEYFDTGMD